MCWFERSLLNVRSIFDVVHGREAGILVQLRNVNHPPEPDYDAPKVTWLEGFVLQKPYVACNLVSRRISAKGGEEMAVVDVAWRPYLKWRRSDLATSLVKHGRGEVDVQSEGGLEIGGTQWDLNLDSSRQLEDLELDVKRIKELIRREGGGKGEEEDEDPQGIFSVFHRILSRLKR